MTMQGRGHLTLSAGANLIIYIFWYNLFTAGGVLLQGGYRKHKLSSSKRGRMLKPTKLRMLKPTKLNNFDDGQVMMDKHL